MADPVSCIVAQVQLPPWLESLGRMGVLLVHIPVGLLLLAGLIEFGRAVRRKDSPSPLAALCLGVGALWLTGVTGWVRRDFASSPALGWHTSLSFATAGVAVLSLIVMGLGRQTAYRLGVIGCALLAVVTGHFGGTLAHGPGYLNDLAKAGSDLKARVVARLEGHPIPPGSSATSNVRTVVAIENNAPGRDLTTLALPTAFPADGKIDFIRDVQPILAHSCHECHGPDKHRGQLRLDNKAMTFAGGNSGPSIVSGKSAESVLIKRVLGLGNEKRMPMGEPALPDYQIRILQAWIDQGATWPDHASNDEPSREETHWAYVPPAHHALPKVSEKNEKWPRNGIDHFILARLEKEGLDPSPEADRPTLIRRLSLDLIGLPPTPEEVDAFVADTSLDAYDKLVNRLLSSPHYGERWGRHWLDIARYADTNGYEKDKPREIWPYRDWVIDAINRDVTYDQFVIQQIAGDMLPNASVEDRIATGFHRNTMFNEEGGIDVEEFRYKAIVDRVQTTSTAFLGLTMQCAQCHNHKYDTISQKEYFEFAALLNNADEPTLEIPRPDLKAQRDAILAQVRAAESKLESEFPTHDEQMDWTVIKPDRLKAKAEGVTLTVQPDGSILSAGPIAEKDVYTFRTTADLTDVTSVRVEVLTDPSLPKNGPGRSDNGNFVLTELKIARPITPAPAKGRKMDPLKLVAAQADFSQDRFGVGGAIDNNPTTGWAIATADGNLNQNRIATFRFGEKLPEGTGTLNFTLQHDHSRHPLGKFRISLGKPKADPDAKTPVAERRAKYLAAKMAEWEKSVAGKAVQWTQLDPVTYSRKHGATITKLPDKSLLFTGDNLYRDEYQLGFDTDLKNITAIRMEVLPDEHHPRGGPGRSFTGGWLLSGITVSAAAKDAAPATQPATLELSKASADISPDTIARAIDGRKDTHWTIPNGDGKPHAAVFQLKSPLAGNDGGTRLNVALLQNYHQSENIGRLRISVTTDPRGTIEPTGLPEDVEQIVLTPAAQRTPAQLAKLKQHFLSVTPLLAPQREEIARLRGTMPAYPTTLVMEERAVPRVTRIMHRGEFLQPKGEVQPAVPAVLPPLPQGERNRLALANWLVSPQNPLIGRVTMNRVWATYFGRGIVNTVEDFGVMGEKPSHPELLDWLATELVRQNWSMKSMHRLIVTSATYRQASRVTPLLLEKDPANVLLARGPRLRVEAETVRDIALAASGLLNDKIGGPSVFPPQPAGVSELSYGAMAWTTSEGPDRYRRGLYTFLKRTSPYPGMIVFDGPTSEVTCIRRIRSNTPLQALTTLNDAVFVEAAQAMGKRVVEELASGTADERIERIYRLCVARSPGPAELEKVKAFYETQVKRFRDKQADPAAVALRDPKVIPSGMDLPEVAAWTMVARTVMNLDETVTRE